MSERTRARQRRARWARKFRPAEIDLLLLAEAPPAALDRYFYFPEVATQDSLFREVARMILKKEPTRENKRRLLGELRDRGVFLIDAQLEPVEAGAKVQIGRLIARIKHLSPRRIVIVKVSVFDKLYTPLVDAECPVIGVRVPFPGSGQQTAFRTAMSRALRKAPPRAEP